MKLKLFGLDERMIDQKEYIMKSLKQLAEEGRIKFPPVEKGWREKDGTYRWYNHKDNFEEYGHIMQVEPEDIIFNFDESNALCPSKELSHVILECQRDARYDNDNGFNPFFNIRMGGAQYKIYVNSQPYINEPLTKEGKTQKLEITLSKVKNRIVL